MFPLVHAASPPTNRPKKQNTDLRNLARLVVAPQQRHVLRVPVNITCCCSKQQGEKGPITGCCRRWGQRGGEEVSQCVQPTHPEEHCIGLTFPNPTQQASRLSGYLPQIPSPTRPKILSLSRTGP